MLREIPSLQTSANTIISLYWGSNTRSNTGLVFHSSNNPVATSIIGFYNLCFAFTGLQYPRTNIKNKLVFRLKKVLTWISMQVSMCENLGVWANSSQSRYCDSWEHDLGLSLLSFDSTLASEVWNSPRERTSSQAPDSQMFASLPC